MHHCTSLGVRLNRAIPVDKVRIRESSADYLKPLLCEYLYWHTSTFARQIAGVNSTEGILIGRNVLNQRSYPQWSASTTDHYLERPFVTDR